VQGDKKKESTNNKERQGIVHDKLVEVSKKRRALVGSRGLHEKTEKRSKLIGGGRNKTENRPELGCRFYFEIRLSDWSAPET
jgi:uncharacterized DUF497 family protein